MITPEIIIPVADDAAGLRRTLDSLGDPTLATVVLNDATTTAYAGVCAEYPGVTWVHEPAGGSYAARNAGLAATDADRLLFLDAGTWVEDGYVGAMADALDECPYVGANVRVAGHTAVADHQFPVAQYLAEQQFVPTLALGVRRSVIEDVGAFDARLRSCGDLEFGQRVAAAGYEQAFCEPATVVHPARSRRDWVAKQHRVGRGHAHLQRLYPDRYGAVTAGPPTPDGSGAGRPDPLGLVAKGTGWLRGAVEPEVEA